jgi:hypothetical protein
LVETTSVAVAVPPEARLIVVGEIDIAGPLLMRGWIDTERVTVPLKPLRLVTFRAELPV